MVRIAFILLSMFFAQLVFASSIDSCLSQARKLTHRLEKTDAILSCFDKTKESLSGQACFQAISKLQVHEKSIELSEKINGICFYDSSRFKNITSCLDKVDVFKLASSHDEAVFECYRQFQYSLNQKQCLKVSAVLKYPAKKEYLANHCMENGE